MTCITIVWICGEERGKGGHVHLMARKCSGDSLVENSRPSPEACLDTPWEIVSRFLECREYPGQAVIEFVTRGRSNLRGSGALISFASFPSSNTPNPFLPF